MWKVHGHHLHHHRLYHHHHGGSSLSSSVLPPLLLSPRRPIWPLRVASSSSSLTARKSLHLPIFTPPSPRCQCCLCPPSSPHQRIYFSSLTTTTTDSPPSSTKLSWATARPIPPNSRTLYPPSTMETTISSPASMISVIPHPDRDHDYQGDGNSWQSPSDYSFASWEDLLAEMNRLVRQLRAAASGPPDSPSPQVTDRDVSSWIQPRQVHAILHALVEHSKHQTLSSTRNQPPPPSLRSRPIPRPTRNLPPMVTPPTPPTAVVWRRLTTPIHCYKLWNYMPTLSTSVIMIIVKWQVLLLFLVRTKKIRRCEDGLLPDL